MKKEPLLRTADEIQGFLISAIAGHARIDPSQIDPRASFTDYGLDSLSAAAIMGQLEEKLGQKLVATLPWDYPTIEQLVQHLKNIHARKNH